MIRAGIGLSGVPTVVLKRLLQRVHSDDVPYPLTADVLACWGMQDRSEELLASLRGLNQAAVRIILVCVLAERR